MRFGKILSVFLALFLMLVTVSAQDIIEYEHIAEYEVGRVRDMMVLADGTYVVASDTGLWTLNPDDNLLQKWETPALVSRMFYYNRVQLILAYEDNSMGLWDSREGLEQAHYSGHTAPISSVVSLNASQAFLSASADGTIRGWGNAGDGVETLILELDTGISQLVQHPLGWLLAALGEDNSVHLVLPQGELGVLNFDETVSSIAFHPERQELLVGTADGKIHVWNIVSYASFEHEGVAYPLYEVPVPDGTLLTLALVTAGRRDSSFIDPNNPEDGEILWEGNWRTLEPVIASIEESSEILVLDAHSSPVQRFMSHPFNIISIGEDNSLRSWTGNYDEVFTTELDSASEIVFMNDFGAAFFATVDEENNVVVRYVQTGNEFARLPEQSVRTSHFALYMSSVPSIVTATDDGLLHLWRLPEPE